MEKAIKLIVVINLIIIMIFMPVSVVNAGLAGGAQSESGASPAPPTPPDASQPSSPPTPSAPSGPSVPVVNIKVYHNEISGTVYDNLGNVAYNKPQGQKDESINEQQENVKIPIENALVLVKNKDGKVIDYCWTGKDRKILF